MRSSRAGHVAAGIRVAGLLLVLGGCAREEPPPPLPAPPSAEQLREDLVGVRFAFFEDDDGPRHWTIEAEEIRRLDIAGQTVSDDGQQALSRVTVALRAESRAITGDLRVEHVRRDSAWSLARVDRAGPNFRAGDRRATLFAVELVDDSTGTGRLVLDPIAVFEAGGYRDPLRDWRRAAASLADSSWASDSLYAAAVDSVEALAARSVAPPRSRLRVLAAGASVAQTTVDSSVAVLGGCEVLSAFARRPPGTTPWALATTSSIMGGAVAPGRAVSARERRDLERIARERLELAGADPSRLRARGVVAADLDGDGVDEVVGAFSSGPEANRHAVLVGVEPSATGGRLLFERRPGAGYETFELAGVVDVDGDGAVETVALEEGAEVFRYLVLTSRSGRYADAFRGGGGGC